MAERRSICMHCVPTDNGMLKKCANDADFLSVFPYWDTETVGEISVLYCAEHFAEMRSLRDRDALEYFSKRKWIALIDLYSYTSV